MFEYDCLQNDPKGYKYKLKGGDYLYDLPQCFDGFKGCTTNLPQGQKPYVEVRYRRLTIRDGYQWNGANAFPDTKWILRASMVHDALCQLLNEGKWSTKAGGMGKRDYRRCADRELFCIVRGDKGVGWAKTIYSAVRGYANGWYFGGLVGGLTGLLRGKPNFDCGSEV